MLDYGLLGPTEVSDAGRILALGGQRQRALLTILLLAANQPVSRDSLWLTGCGAIVRPRVRSTPWRYTSPASGRCSNRQPGIMSCWPSRARTCCGRPRKASMCAASSAWPSRAVMRWPGARRAKRQRRWARPWRSGVVHRWPTSAMSRSRRRRSPAWRNCGPVSLRTGSKLISPRAAQQRGQRVGGAAGRVPAARAASPAADDRAVPLRQAGGCARCLPVGPAGAAGRTWHRAGSRPAAHRACHPDAGRLARSPGAASGPAGPAERRQPMRAVRHPAHAARRTRGLAAAVLAFAIVLVLLVTVSPGSRGTSAVLRPGRTRSASSTAARTCSVPW